MPVDLKDYNTVAMRIAEFRAKHPEGSLRPVNPDKPYEILTLGDRIFVVYTAAAYRTPDDTMPGIGIAWEPFPGRTPYTKDSELMNSETSAWGRAIVAVLAADTVAGIATRDEIENRRAEQEAASKTPSRPAASRAKAETPKAAETASEPKKATSGDLAKLVKAAESAKTADQLNAAWKAAGEIGALQEAVAFPGTSESGTFQQYLYHRADAIKSAKSD